MFGFVRQYSRIGTGHLYKMWFYCHIAFVLDGQDAQLQRIRDCTRPKRRGYQHGGDKAMSNSTFRYHIKPGERLESAIEAYMRAPSDGARKREFNTIKDLIAADEFLRQFRRDGHSREILFEPDAASRLQVQLGAPEMDLQEGGPRWPARLCDHVERIDAITAQVYFALPPTVMSLLPGRYVADLVRDWGPFALVVWDSSSGGRYRANIECTLDHEENWEPLLHPRSALGLIWELSHRLMTGQAVRLRQDDQLIGG